MVPPPKSILPANPKTQATGMPFFGKSTYQDYGSFRGLADKPIQLDPRDGKQARNPLGASVPFIGSSLYEASYKPFKINPRGSREPLLEAVTAKPPLFEGQYETEHQTLDGSQAARPAGRRKCCHVLQAEKDQMLQASVARLEAEDPQLASRVTAASSN